MRNSEKDPNIQRPVEPVDLVCGPQAHPAGGTGAAEALHVCFHCSGELVYPLDWTEEGPHHWRVLLRCPECERAARACSTRPSWNARQRARPRLGRAARDLRRLTHANMAEEIEFFIRALEADVISPPTSELCLTPRSAAQR